MPTLQKSTVTTLFLCVLLQKSNEHLIVTSIWAKVLRVMNSRNLSTSSTSKVASSQHPPAGSSITQLLKIIVSEKEKSLCSRSFTVEEIERLKKAIDEYYYFELLCGSAPFPQPTQTMRLVLFFVFAENDPAFVAQMTCQSTVS